jgi:alcohol dehydrogenase class IV
MSEREAAARSVEEVEAMIERLGITRGLRNHAVRRESLAPLSAKAFEDSCHKTNIRPCTQDDLLRLYEESW